MELYTDASSTKDYGGYFQGKWFSSSWPNDISSPKDKHLSMAFLELYPIVVASLLWGSEWKCEKIFCWCDNEGVYFVLLYMGNIEFKIDSKNDSKYDSKNDSRHHSMFYNPNIFT
jgi:hypothetical protein